MIVIAVMLDVSLFYIYLFHVPIPSLSFVIVKRRLTFLCVVALQCHLNVIGWIFVLANIYVVLIQRHFAYYFVADDGGLLPSPSVFDRHPL